MWHADQVLVEESGTAIGLIEEMRFRVSGLIGIKPDRDKISRMSIASAIFEAGQVHFPQRAAWLAELETELFSFPGSKHDDQVDSISQTLLHGKNGLAIWTMLGD
jgi:predicted phage terminase large subunit-like protein